jgi:hypothetical protein
MRNQQKVNNKIKNILENKKMKNLKTIKRGKINNQPNNTNKKVQNHNQKILNIKISEDNTHIIKIIKDNKRNTKDQSKV